MHVAYALQGYASQRADKGRWYGEEGGGVGRRYVRVYTCMFKDLHCTVSVGWCHVLSG